MKNIISLLMFTGILFAVSCDDFVDADLYGQSTNLASFVNSTENIVITADGLEHDYDVQMAVQGPRLGDVTGNVNAAISVDPSSTAVQGTHFRLNSPDIVLSPSGNLLGNFPITILTAGIMPPLAENPVIVLNVTSASGDGSVIASGRQVVATILYLCNSDLAGNYTLSYEYWRFGGLQSTGTRPEFLTETGSGEYRTSSAGHWAAGAIGGEDGFDIIDVCDEITIPAQNLVNLYSNIVEGDAGMSNVDPVTGDLHMEYTICASDCRQYFADYVKL